MSKGKIVLIVIACLVGLVVLFYLGVALNLVMLPGRVVNKVATPENVIFNYEYFHQQYQDIQATAIKIKTAYDATQMSWLAEEQKSTYMTNYIGTQNFMATLVGDYNAKSKMLTRKLFKDRQLPYQIEVTVTKGDVKITEKTEDK